MKPETIFVQIKRPEAGSPQGIVAEGAYILEDGVVTLTDRNGEPAVDGDGRKYTHKLVGDEKARVIAGRLTKELRNSLRGSAFPTQDFGRAISYPKLKNA
jgi:hypothetical protein